MYFKGLTLQGFKSFADKVELRFGQGVSVVVGPNGSGKSNIADAIRWVLGEQSAKSLRGAKMEDIIFAGSAKRKAVGMAEISLSLDNSSGYFPSQYSEITITRRLYRSGESEFLINKRSCRLKDVHQLFMDTGLGKETFSIIGQGKVEEILNSKPEDRRFIVEDVAGIIKYKNRKREAMRKLEETQQHLQRISDLINELKNRLDPLAKQAEQAKKYKAIKEEWDVAEISLLVQETKEIELKTESLKKQSNTLIESKEQLETNLYSYNSKIEQLKLSLTQHNEWLYSEQQNLYDLKNSIDKLESNIIHNQQLIKEHNHRQKITAEEIKKTTEKSTQISNELKELEAKLASQITEKHLQTDKLANQQRQVNQQKEELNNMLTEYEELKNQLFDMASNRVRQKNLTEFSQIELEKLIKNKNEKTKQMHEIEKEIAVLAERMQYMEEKIHHWQKEEKKNNDNSLTTERELKILTATKAKLDEEYKNLEINLQQLNSRLKALTEMQNSLEGYQYGVKAILKERLSEPDQYKGIVGVLGELIQVEKKFITAIEVALGGSIQNIVTNTQEDAKKAIQLLKEKKAGRCTFLPLQSIKAMPKITVKSATGIYGVASDLITTEDKLNPIIGYLLNRTIVVHDIDIAIKVSQELNYKVKVVTLSGEVFSPGGALTGGSIKTKQLGFLSRKTETNHLASEINKLTFNLNKKAEEVTKILEEIKTKQLLMKQLENNVQQNKLMKVNIDKDYQQLELELIRSKNMHKTLKHEQRNIQDEIDRITKEKELAHHSHFKYEQEELSIKEKIKQTQQQIDEKEKYLGQQNERLTEEKIKNSQGNQQIEYWKKQISQLKKQNLEDQQNLTEKQEQINQLATKISQLNENIQQQKNELIHNTKGKKGREEKIEALNDNIVRLTEEIKTREETIGQVTKQLNQQQEHIHSIEIEQTRLESAQKNFLERLKENYSLTLLEAAEKANTDIQKEEVINIIKNCKKTINQMGQVNLQSIEEFQQVSQRYEFLEKQYTDLEEAKIAIDKVIDEMDVIMIKRFSQSFKELNYYFAEVFEELFGGGNAELILTDKQNMLETGIEIIAQPPGKKPQHLSLLSGGERAMTAIALLFASLKVKPAPFCVLDEIEASLDEANVYRFANFLKEFSESTQFIVISHRKGTMEIANVLYGVTMEESGVSKLVSVKLTEAS